VFGFYEWVRENESGCVVDPKTKNGCQFRGSRRGEALLLGCLQSVCVPKFDIWMRSNLLAI